MNLRSRSKRSRVAMFVGLALLLAVIPANPVSALNRSHSPLLDPVPPPDRTPEAPPAPAPAPALQAVDPAEQRVLQEVSRIEGVPAERLLAGYHAEWTLPLTGAAFTYIKAVDKETGREYTLGLDRQGALVDPEALRRAERQAAGQAYGKLHPSLVRHLQQTGSQGTVRVSIWLDMGGRDASVPRPASSEGASMSPEHVRQLRVEGLARAAQIHQEVEAPLLEFLPALGGKVLEAATTAPIVFAELPAQALAQVAARSDVQVIDLVVTGGPEQAGGQEKQPPSGPEMAIAGPASKANIVEARGFDGTGVTTAVVEGDSIAYANPYIADGTCGPNAACPSLAEHATAVGGILASTHSTARGTAPGIGSALLSANGGTWDLPEMQSATSWALGQGADVLNNSYYLEADGAMHNSDRWLDYVVRNSVVLEVKSAGNRGESDAYVTSPGLGYNVLTVGAAEDKGTLTWDDDTMSPISSYVEPGGRQKPEVSAMGCANWTGGTGIVITSMASPWIRDQGCGTSYAAPIAAGGGALMMQRNTALDSWPEAEKAILIATALHNIEGDAAISAVDGAGAVDLAAADSVVANGWWTGFYVTPGMFDASNNYAWRTVHLDAGERVRVALAYDSNPSADFNSDPLEGDLDLYLLNPSSVIVASSAGVDSWESIDYVVPTSGDYTVRIENHGGSFAGVESTYAGVAIWPGHYVLEAYAPQMRDKPPGAWNQDSGDDYRLTRGSFWNAVGLRSPSGADYDLFLFNNSVYGDPADHARLAYSTSTSSIDVVLVDGNHAPTGNYYETVSAYAGSGNYYIEQATRTSDVYDGTYGPYTMTPAQVVRIWDSNHAANVRKYYALKPTSGNGDLGMALFHSDAANSASWYQGLGQAVAYADAAGAGGQEAVSYQSAAGDWYGLVAFNKAATSNTSFYLYADTTAPTGSIAINGGVAYANATAATLALSAGDAQTGVAQMRFSNNGSTWTAWEPYAASRAWPLPAGDGTKTVYVQYKNNAEMVSESFADTIVLDMAAPTSSATSPAGTKNAGFTVSWSGSDNLSGIASYTIQYRVGLVGAWTNWLVGTTATSAVFGPAAPVLVQYGQTYYFRVRATDNAGNVEPYPGGNGGTSTFVWHRVFLPGLMR